MGGGGGEDGAEWQRRGGTGPLGTLGATAGSYRLFAGTGRSELLALLCCALLLRLLY